MNPKLSIEEKLKHLDKLELLQAYSNIQEYAGPDQFDLLQQALQNNLKGLFKTGYLNVSNFEDLQNLIKICSQPDLLGLYFKYAKLHLQNHHQSYSKLQNLMQVLGHHLDKLTQEYRKQGSLQEKFHLNSNSPFQNQKVIIELITILQPKYYTINPELFKYLLTPFLVSQKHFHLTILIQLADTIKDFMEKQENNSDYYWLLLFQFIFESAQNQNFKSILILVSNFYPEIIQTILYSNQKYFLLKYFNSVEKTIKIFKGIFEHYISNFGILITTQFSQIFLQQMNQYESKLYAEILHQMYYQVILPKILPNIQMFDSHKEIVNLLLFYANGIQELTLEFVEKLVHSIKLLLNLKFQSREFSTSINSLLKSLITNIPSLIDHKELKDLQLKTKPKSLGYFYDYSESKEIHHKWQFPKALNEKFNSFQLLEKKKDQYVGLENLTNTCYMNSFIQSLFMNSDFRNFILTQKESDKPILKELRDLFLLLTFQKQGFCSPHQLKRKLSQPYADSTDQQDVNEFIHHFLDNLEKELSNEGQNYLQNLFFGNQRSVFTCSKCKKVQFGVQEKLFGLDLFFSHKSQSSSILNDIPNMIKEIAQVEEVEFECKNCKKKYPSTKQNQIITLPPFLMITLQRFTYDAQLQQKIKILQKVNMEFKIDFSELLRFENTVNPGTSQYQLYAFIVHLKSDSGHYITYARQIDQNSETWISFDDTFIMEQRVIDQKVFDEQLMQIGY